MSTGTIIIIFVIAAVIYGLIFLYRWNMKKKLTEEGRYVKRSTSQLESKEIYTLRKVDFSDVVNAVNNQDWSSTANTTRRAFPNGKRIEFACKGVGGIGPWTGELKMLSETEDSCQYLFHFTEWENTTYHMQITMTNVERAILSLDVKAMVENHMQETKSKTSFF